MKKNVLLISLDMTNLAAIGALALRADDLCTFLAFGGGPGNAFLLLACEAPLFVAVETREFGFQTGRQWLVCFPAMIE